MNFDHEFDVDGISVRIAGELGPPDFRGSQNVADAVCTVNINQAWIDGTPVFGPENTPCPS